MERRSGAVQKVSHFIVLRQELLDVRLEILIAIAHLSKDSAPGICRVVNDGGKDVFNAGPAVGGHGGGIMP